MDSNSRLNSWSQFIWTALTEKCLMQNDAYRYYEAGKNYYQKENIKIWRIAPQCTPTLPDLPPPPPALLQIDGSNSTLIGETVSEGGGFASRSLHNVGAGLNLRHYEEEVNKLRKDNLDLRLRIYLMEESKGLQKTRPGDKENVFRVNLDLRVENETMKKALAEKTGLLEDLHDAIQNQEVERLREKTEYESQIISLRQSLVETQMMSQFDSPNGAAATVSVGERSQALLFEAFGSMNLGKPGDLQGKVEELEREVGERNELIRTLQGQVSSVARESLDERAQLRGRISELHLQVERSTEDMSRMESELIRIQQCLDSKEVEYDQLEVHVGRLSGGLKRREDMVKVLEDQLTTSQFCLKGVTEANTIQRKEMDDLGKEVKKRDKAIEILKAEYEALKTKVKKYRSEKADSSRTSEPGDRIPAEIKRLEAALQEAARREEALKAEIQRLEEEVNQRPVGDGAAARKVTVLKAELRSCHVRAMKAGAKKAMARAKTEYGSAVDDYSVAIRSSFDAVRKRLEELAEFLQRLISMEADGMLDLSALSACGVMDLLHRSLEDSRRMSQSLLMERNDLNDTQCTIGGGGGIEQLPQFHSPELRDISVDEDPADYEDVEGRIEEYEALLLELKDNVRQKIDAQKETEQLRMSLKEAGVEYNNAAVDTKHLSRELRCAMDLVATLKAEKKALTQKLTEIKSDLDNNIANVMEELKKVNTTNQKLGRKVDALKTELAQKDEKIDGQSSDITNIMEELKKSNALNQKLGGNVDALKEVLAQKEDRIDGQTCDITSAMEELKKSNATNQKLGGKVDLLQMELAQTEDKIGSLEVRVDAKKAKVSNHHRHRAVFDSKENFEEQELALPPCHSARKSLGMVNDKCCDCQARIEELGRLVERMKTQLDSANEKIHVEAERKKKVEKAVRKEISKTKKVLRKTNTPTIQE